MNSKEKKGDGKTKGIGGFAVAVTIILLFLGYLAFSGGNKEPADKDAFAQCLSEKGVKMYGAYWCPHCNNQKKMFGESFKFLNYIECSDPEEKNPSYFSKECAAEGIEGFPTWRFPGGVERRGELSFEELANLSGCSLE